MPPSRSSLSPVASGFARLASGSIPIGRRLARLLLHPRDQWRAWTRAWFFRVAHRFTPLVACGDADGLFLVPTSDRVIGYVTFMTGGFERQSMDKALSVLAGQPGHRAGVEGRSVLEVGANIGTQTVRFLTRFGAASILAIEPEPGNFEVLKLNIAANGLTPRAVARQLALSDRDGSAVLELSAETTGDHRVRVPGGGRAGSEFSRETIQVPALRLDTLIERGEVFLSDLGVVWIDTQGHEAHVLDGAAELLRSDVPIVIEYWPYGLRRAGGLERFHQIVAEHYSHVIDLRTRDNSPPRLLPAAVLPALEASYGWVGAPDPHAAYTDLVLGRDLRLP